MLEFLRRPRVVAVGNLLVLALLGLLPFQFPQSRTSGGQPFLVGWLAITGGLALFWIWIFIVNPREWAVVKDGRLHWRRGQILPCTESVSVLEVSQLLTETLMDSGNSRRGGNVDRHWVILKSGAKFQVPEAATELQVLYSMRALNPSIERKCVSKPWSLS